MQTQDDQPGEDTKGGAWLVSDASQVTTEQATRTARKTSTGRRKATSSRKTTGKAEEKPKTAAKRKTAKAAKDDDKPATKRKTSKTAKDAEKPKTTTKPKAKKPASQAKTGASKRKTTKKETTTASSKRRPRRKQDLGDLISELLERRAAGEKGSEAVVEAILEHLTKNLGLSSDAATLVVGYILDKLVKSKKAKAPVATGEATVPETGELDLGGFFRQTRSGPAVDIRPEASRGELEELAHTAGLDPETAAASLKQVLKMLGEAGP